MSERFLLRLGESMRAIDETRSIMEHLQHLLNSREGLSPTNPDYGLPDLTDIVQRLPEGAQVLQNAIRDVILKYEPRLTKVRVRFVPSDDAFVLYFEISGRRSNAQRTPFRVRTAMVPGNRFEVRH